MEAKQENEKKIKTLDVEKKEAIIDPRRWTWLIFGGFGVGKTKLASQIKDSYFLKLEPGHDCIPHYGDDCYNWQDLLEVVALIIKEQHNFKTVVVDPFDKAYDYCMEYILNKHGWKDITDPGWGRGFEALKQEFYRPFLALKQKGFGMMFLGGERIESASFGGIEYSKYWPDLPKTGRQVLCPFVNVIGWMRIERKEDDGAMRMVRVISFDPRPDVCGRDRSNLLARHGDIIVEPEAMCWKRLEEKLKGGEQKDGRDTKSRVTTA